jgi:hypothetical protein
MHRAIHVEDEDNEEKEYGPKRLAIFILLF